MLPYKTMTGVEEELIQLANLKKKIRGLETMASKGFYIRQYPYKEQAKELLKSIDSPEYLP